MSTRVGIVTVLYNSEDVVDDFIASLARQSDLAFRLYVIDNSPAPTALDRCRQLAAEHGIDAEFLFNGANLGVAKANNQGIELALRDGCTSVLLSNNDTEFAAGTLAALVGCLRAGASVATPKILYHGPGKRIWYAGGRLDTWTMRTPHLGIDSVDRGQHDAPGATGYAPTCFLLVDAAVFARVGLMDERYFVYYDDTDFMWRLARAGIAVRYVPSATVLHKVSSSTGGEQSPFSVYFSNRNRIYFIRKNLHGLRRWVALAYTLSTRLPQATRMSRPLAARLWAGVRDGFRLPVTAGTN
jgi:GT2 family glycosyltransferase